MSDETEEPSPPQAPRPAADDAADSLTLTTYLRLRGIAAPRGRRRRRIRDEDGENVPFAPGRDPRGLGDIVAEVTREAGWDSHLAQEDVLRRWSEVAGEQTAAHALPVALEGGVLTVQCDSTAWAKQLSLLRAEIVTRIVRHHPDAGITGVRFIGPDVPSWKWGPRTIPGRGPRDTYG
jgi:predicted nucleic acid-binding Zn ribbon protein